LAQKLINRHNASLDIFVSETNALESPVISPIPTFSLMKSQPHDSSLPPGTAPSYGPVISTAIVTTVRNFHPWLFAGTPGDGTFIVVYVFRHYRVRSKNRWTMNSESRSRQFAIACSVAPQVDLMHCRVDQFNHGKPW